MSEMTWTPRQVDPSLLPRAVTDITLAHATAIVADPESFRATLRATSPFCWGMEWLRVDGGKVIVRVLRDNPRRYLCRTYGY